MAVAARLLPLLLALATLPVAPALAQSPAIQAPTSQAPATAPAAPPAGAPVACPARDARIRLAIVDPPPVIDSTVSSAALQARTGRVASAGSHHLGLTTSSVEWQSELNATYRQGPNGQICAVPAQVVLTLVQQEHRVELAAELPVEGCLWRAVLAHERRHVAVNKRTLRQAAAEARAAAEAWALAARARGATVEEAMTSLQAGLRRAIEPSLASMAAARGRAHQQIDSAEEYRRLSSICTADQAALRARLRAP